MCHNLNCTKCWSAQFSQLGIAQKISKNTRFQPALFKDKITYQSIAKTIKHISSWFHIKNYSYLIQVAVVLEEEKHRVVLKK